MENSNHLPAETNVMLKFKESKLIALLERCKLQWKREVVGEIIALAFETCPITGHESNATITIKPNGKYNFACTHADCVGVTWTTVESLLQQKARELKAAEVAEGDGSWSDVQAAKEIIKAYGNVLRYDHTEQRWLIWRGHWWVEDRSGEVLRMVSELTEGNAANEKLGKMNNALQLASVLAPISVPRGTVRFDAKPTLLPVQNGVVDLTTGTLCEGEQDDWLTFHLSVDYDPNVAAPEWEKMLAGIFDGNLAHLEWVQRSLGYSITGLTREQDSAWMKGDGSNGKSSMIEVLLALFPEVVCKVGKSFFEETANPGRFDGIQLKNKRLVFCDELPNRIDEDKIKDIAHGGPITTDVKNKDIVTFHSTAKLWFACNNLPNFRDSSDGFWRSVKSILFPIKFKDADKATVEELASGKVKLKDPDLLDCIVTNEKAGVLRWVVEGARRYFEHGRRLSGYPVDWAESTEEMREDSNPYVPLITQWFEDRNRENWMGTITELMTSVNDSKYETLSRRTTKTPQRFSAELKRAAATLEKAGIRCEFSRGAKGKRTWLISTTNDGQRTEPAEDSLMSGPFVRKGQVSGW